MDDQSEGEFLLRLFPLPNLVFFPKTRLPLHVFEPRYRALVADALASDRKIGMILLRPGWKEDYFGNPPIHAFGTVGVIEQIARLEDGKFNLMLRGVARYRILQEVAGEAPYRTARVEVVPERETSRMEAYAQREWLVDLARRYIEYMPGGMEVPELETVGLEALTNALIMSLDLEMETKQSLLETSGVGTRAERVGKELCSRIEALQFLAGFRRDSNPESN